MPRTKGSKNKDKVKVAQGNFAALIEEKAAAKESLTAEVATLEENLETIKADLKDKKVELKKLDTELSKLEAKKAEADAKAAAEAQKAELEETLQKLMADGVSAAEILEKLKSKNPPGCCSVWLPQLGGFFAIWYNLNTKLSNKSEFVEESNLLVLNQLERLLTVCKVKNIDDIDLREYRRIMRHCPKENHTRSELLA